MFAMGAPFLGFSQLFFVGIKCTEVSGRDLKWRLLATILKQIEIYINAN